MKRIITAVGTSVLLGLANSPTNAGGQKGTVPTQPNAGQQRSTFQGNIQQTPWFNSPQIRQQFNMNDTQFNRLNTAHQNAWTQYQKGITGLDMNLSADQRQQRIRDLELNYHKDISNSANSVFTDPQQRQRYNQLYWQYRGYGAFEDPTVAQKLHLTADQREKLSQYQQDWTTQMNELAPIYRTNGEEATKRFNTMQNEYNKRLNTLLTPEQQQNWRQMIGDPYTFHPGAYFQNNSPGSNGKK